MSCPLPELSACAHTTPSSGVCVPTAEASTWCSLDIYRNPFASPDARVDFLLGRLTTQEKVDMLQTTHSASLPGYISRFGLEEYTCAECLHGYCSSNTTVFPQSITLAASFDVDLIKSVGVVIGTEARGKRNDFEKTKQLPNRTLHAPGLACFSPQINIARDPR